MNSPESDIAHWFAEHVQPHDASLRAYVRGSFPKLRDCDDVVQESYLRVWLARTKHPIDSAKAFLFTVARRLALDVLRRNSPVSLDSSPGAAQIDPSPDVFETVSRNEKVRILGEALATLPRRCREITMLRKIKSMSQREVGALLGISERTVEVQVARGVKRCEEYLRARGVRGLYEP